MRLFVRNLALFLALMVCVDFVGGWAMQILRHHARSGDTARNELVARSLDADILIFGSSRAIHHYVPQIFEDSLGMSCYNLGNDGQGILLFYPRYEMLCRHHVPKLIIYEAFADFDLNQDDRSKYLGWLRPYYGEPTVDSLFRDVDPSEQYKMQSRLYRYNGKLLQMVFDNLRAENDVAKGYDSVFGVMDYDIEQLAEYVRPAVDTLKVKYHEKLIKACRAKGTQLVYVVSPFYKGNDRIAETYAPLLRLCQAYGIPFVDAYYDPEISRTRSFFSDSYHLNDDGARAFSQKAVGLIRNAKCSDE